MLEVTPVQLFLKVTGSGYLAAVQVKPEENAKTHYNCLIPEGTWQTCHAYALTLAEEEEHETIKCAEVAMSELSCLSMQRTQYVQMVYRDESSDLAIKTSRKRKMKLGL